MSEKSCCFIGHRKIECTPELLQRLRKLLHELIEKGTVNYIFGDRSEFDSLCYELVTELKAEYPWIKRINFRKEYGDADANTMQFLIKGYEKSICPKGVDNAGRASYVERNQAMINNSDFCVFYYDKTYLPPRRKYGKSHLTDYQPKSGTAIAYTYAIHKKKVIYNLFPKEQFFENEL